MQPVIWNFNSAKSVIERENTYQTKQSYCKISKVFLGVVSGALVISSYTKFSAVKLFFSAAAAISAIVIHLLKKGSPVDTRGLSKEKRAELVADEFISQLAQTDLHNYDAISDLKEDLNFVSSGFIFLRFNPFKKEHPEFILDDRLLSEEKIIEVLHAATKKDVIIHLKSLEKYVYDQSKIDKLKEDLLHMAVDGKEREEIKRSTIFSTKYVRRCLDECDIEKMNRQLEALAVKYLRSEKGVSLLPPIQIDGDKTVVITSNCGEVGLLETVLEPLNISGIAVKIRGYGFHLRSQKFQPSDWYSYLEKFTKTTQYRLKLIDETSAVTPLTIFQSKTLSTKIWTPSLSELRS